MILYRPGFRMLCVDPGLRGCGVAEFTAGNLTRAAYVKNPVLSGRGYGAHSQMARAVHEWRSSVSEKCIIEHPRVYPGSAQQKGDPNDLLDVCAVGAAIASICEVATDTVFPSDWKGQVPKEMMTERISKAITPEERLTIEKCPATLMHNVVDAVGIGFHALGRLNKRMVHRGD